MNTYEIQMTDAPMLTIKANHFYVDRNGKLHLRILTKDESEVEEVFVAHEGKWDYIFVLDE